jgi:hypothetical protein
MESGAPPRAVFSGLDEVPAAIDPLASSPVLGALLYLGWARFGPLPCLALAALSLGLLVGRRFRLAISLEGIEVVELAAWIIPFRTTRYPLDAKVDLYQSFEADEPEGLCIEPRVGWGQSASDCFGPHFSQARLVSLHRAATEALARCRAASPAATHRLRFDLQPGLEARFETLGRRYWDSGRLREVRLSQPTTLSGISLPAGTTLEMNADGYLDPRSPDRLTAAVLSAPAALPLQEQPVALGGCRVCFDSRGRAWSADAPFAGPTEVQGLCVDGGASLGWNERGVLDRFTLARSLAVGRLELPAGSRFSPWISLSKRTAPAWYVHPGAPVTLPQLIVNPSQTLLISADRTRVLGAMVDHDLTVEGVLLSGGRLHLPLDASLRIDLRACRKMGLVQRAKRS